MIRFTRLFAFIASLLLLAGQATAQQADRWINEGWKTDFSKTSVDFTEILSGGPPKDGIPPIDNPVFKSVPEIKDLTPKDPVIGLEINGDARAYPLRVLTWHEIVNDVVGEKPVAVTYCPLCNAAIVFDAKVDGKVLTFGTTGKLRNSDLVMYDRATESWWQQFTGTGIVGANLGKELKLIPARLESWASFSKRHPEGKVLVPNNPRFRNYGRNPYLGYDDAARPFLYNGSMPEGISPMARVVLVRRKGEEPLVLAMQKVRNAGEVKMDGFIFSWEAGRASALNSAYISKGKDVGAITVEKLDGEKRTLVPYDVTFAFVAHAFHPKAKIIKQ